MKLKLLFLTTCVLLSAACSRRPPLSPSSFAESPLLYEALEDAADGIDGIRFGGSQSGSSSGSRGVDQETVTERAIVAAIHCPAEKRNEFVRAVAQSFREEIELAGGFLEEIPPGADLSNGEKIELKYGIEIDNAEGKIRIRISDADASSSFPHLVGVELVETVTY